MAQAKRAEAYYLRAVKDYMQQFAGRGGGGRKCTVPPTKGLGFKCIRVRASEDHYMRAKKSCFITDYARDCVHYTRPTTRPCKPVPDSQWSPVASVDRRRSYSY